MNGLSSHVLDTALGQPARGVPVTLEVAAADAEAEGWSVVTRAVTDADGRVRDLLGGRTLETAVYRLTFDTGAYFAAAGRPVFYPRVQIEVAIAAPDEHHHLPLLLSPFGYSTYRGS
jgi:5-hydroxyisourate hydrolase